MNSELCSVLRMLRRAEEQAYHQAEAYVTNSGAYEPLTGAVLLQTRQLRIEAEKLAVGLDRWEDTLVYSGPDDWNRNTQSDLPGL